MAINNKITNFTPNLNIESYYTFFNNHNFFYTFDEKEINMYLNTLNDHVTLIHCRNIENKNIIPCLIELDNKNNYNIIGVINPSKILLCLNNVLIPANIIFIKLNERQIFYYGKNNNNILIKKINLKIINEFLLNIYDNDIIIQYMDSLLNLIKNKRPRIDEDQHSEYSNFNYYISEEIEN